ncbi:vegetative cell wall protein gp1-like [Triticum dicoccoides]|uniref:vegetative cell wall protein gp1-like n=1 Tax=Triticum dicoccoides TaxID=85692 RepID=UPI00188EEAF9|nr:vegetative cell wall protein gp1-like [Triticum dicoccoides]
MANHRPRPPSTSHLELLQDHNTAESQHSTRSTSAAAHLTPAPWSSKFVGSPLLRSGRERVPGDLPWLDPAPPPSPANAPTSPAPVLPQPSSSRSSTRGGAIAPGRSSSRSAAPANHTAGPAMDVGVKPPPLPSTPAMGVPRAGVELRRSPSLPIASDPARTSSTPSPASPPRSHCCLLCLIEQRHRRSPSSPGTASPILGLHGSAASTVGLLSSFAPSPTLPETFPLPFA